MPIETSPLAQRIIGCAIAVHRELGPGLLESTYTHCLAHEFAREGIPYRRECALPVRYKGLLLDCGYRVDFVVNDAVLIEVKSVDVLHANHHAQILTYLKLSGIKQGFLINFNVPRVVDGLKSFLVTPDRKS